MIYPFVDLMEMEADPPSAGFDVAPVILQFETYVRFVMGVAFDRCRQLRDRLRSSDHLSLLDNVLQIHEKNSARVTSGQVQDKCLSKYRSNFITWCKRNGHTELINYIPEPGNQKRTANCILIKQRKTITLGEYLWNIILLIETIQKLYPEDKVLPFLERSVLAISIYVEMRNKFAHDLTEGHRKKLLALREWLQEQGDPVFAEEGSDNCCSLIGPREHENGNIICSFLLNQTSKKGVLPYDFLHRKDLIVEYRKPSCEFEDALFLRIPRSGTGKEQYFRLSPFITVKKNMQRLKNAEYGMLLNNTLSGEYRYRNIRITSPDYNKYGALPDDPYLQTSEENIHEFDKEYCFFIPSASENISNKMKIIGDKTYLYISRHPEFNTAINQNKPFPYYPVMDDEGKKRMEQLQKSQSGISFIFLTGHGGLGKTHLVLHLLRTKYNTFYSPKNNDLRFDQIVFLSAKQTSMQVNAERIETNLDHDIEDYQSMIYLLAELLLNEQILKQCSRNLTALETELINNRKKQLIFIDDLDTLKMDEQKKICIFFNRFKSEDHRVTITSRVVPPMLSSLVAQQTTIMLHPLNQKQSLAFCRKYKSEGQLIIDRIAESEADNIHRITGGIPLNLVLLLHLMQQAYSREQLYKQAQILIKNSTNFIFEHILEALDDKTRRTLGILIRFEKTINLRNQASSIGFYTLRLLVPSLSDNEYASAIDELEYYAITAKSDDNIIYLRSDVFLELTDDITLNADSQSIIRYVEQKPEKWRLALDDLPLFLNYILNISRDWKNSGDKDERKWANNSAQIALSPQYQNYIFPHTRNEWRNLFIEPGTNIIDQLAQRVEKLQKHDPETETAISLLQDRYYRVLDTLEQCEKYWTDNRELIDRAFTLCASVLQGLYNNRNPRVDEIIGEADDRLHRCYYQFAQNVNEKVSPTCEQLLDEF